MNNLETNLADLALAVSDPDLKEATINKLLSPLSKRELGDLLYNATLKLNVPTHILDKFTDFGVDPRFAPQFAGYESDAFLKNAVKTNNIEQVEYWLAKGCNASSFPESAIEISCEKKNTAILTVLVGSLKAQSHKDEVLEWLIRSGNRDVVNEIYSQPDQQLFSPLSADRIHWIRDDIANKSFDGLKIIKDNQLLDEKEEIKLSTDLIKTYKNDVDMLKVLREEFNSHEVCTHFTAAIEKNYQPEPVSLFKKLFK